MRLQRLVAAVILASGPLAAAPAAAQDAQKPPAPSIAIIDVDRIMRESLAVQSGRTQIDQIADELQQEIATEEKNLRAEEQQLQQQRTLLTPEVFAQRRQALQERNAELQQRVRALRQTLDRGFSRTMHQIQVVLFEEVSELAGELGANLVLPSTTTIFFSTAFDISDQALQRLNDRLSEVEISLEREDENAPGPAPEPAPPRN